MKLEFSRQIFEKKKKLKYQILWKSFRASRVVSCAQTDRQTWQRWVAFRNVANESKNICTLCGKNAVTSSVKAGAMYSYMAQCALNGYGTYTLGFFMSSTWIRSESQKVMGSKCPWFEPRLEDWLSWLKTIMTFISSSIYLCIMYVNKQF